MISSPDNNRTLTINERSHQIDDNDGRYRNEKIYWRRSTDDSYDLLSFRPLPSTCDHSLPDHRTHDYHQRSRHRDGRGDTRRRRSTDNILWNGDTTETIDGRQLRSIFRHRGRGSRYPNTVYSSVSPRCRIGARAGTAEPSGRCIAPKRTAILHTHTKKIFQCARIVV